MIFLLNYECVLAEIAELAKAHISGLLKVEPAAVTVDLELAPGGKIIPTFNVEAPVAGAWEKGYIQKSIAEVWLGWAKQELNERLAGLRSVKIRWSKHRGSQEDSSRASSETPEETAGETTIPESGPVRG